MIEYFRNFKMLSMTLNFLKKQSSYCHKRDLMKPGQVSEFLMLRNINIFSLSIRNSETVTLYVNDFPRIYSIYIYFVTFLY